MTTFQIICVVVWIGCGILTYGLLFGYMQRQFSTLAERDYWFDRWFSAALALTGPFGLFVTIMTGSFMQGFKWR